MRNMKPSGKTGRMTIMMNRESIEKQIKTIKHQQFILQMKDHWSSEDFDQDREWSNEIRELEKQLKEPEVM